MLLMLLFLFPILSGAVPAFLQSGSTYALCFPLFWFLGIYQRILEGPSTLPIFTKLAQIGCAALLVTVGLAVLTYPIAYLRRVRRLIEGSGSLDTRAWVAKPFDKLLHATLIRPPIRRAVFHFISQTLMRVQRYRIYLVLYGGVGLSIVIATILRLAVVHRQTRVEISPTECARPLESLRSGPSPGCAWHLFLRAISRAVGCFASCMAGRHNSPPHCSSCRPRSYGRSWLLLRLLSQRASASDLWPRRSS